MSYLKTIWQLKPDNSPLVNESFRANLNNLRIEHKIVGKGIKEVRRLNRLANGMDLVFDPPMPDSGVPIGMLGERLTRTKASFTSMTLPPTPAPSRNFSSQEITTR